MNVSMIRITSTIVDGAKVQTVDARQLHVGLEAGKDFSNWIKAQIDRARLVESRDFVKLAQKGELSSTGQTRIDYHLTLDAAKHVAMISGTDKGFEVRDYFIACERAAQAAAQAASVDPIEVLNDPAAMRGLLLNYCEKVLALQATVAEQQPKVDSFERLMGARGSLCLRDAAKALQLQPLKLNQWLQQHKWIYRRVGNGGFLAYQDRLQSGYLTHRTAELRSSYDLSDQPRVVEQVRVTAKGLCKLALLFSVTIEQAA